MNEETRKARQSYPVRKVPLHEEVEGADLANTTAAERLKMMWPLTVDAWAFKGEPLDESRLPRHIVRVLRRGS
jgi:hypothetical protein